MKTFAPPFGILILLLLALSCMYSMPFKAQSIQIDSTFTTDGEIFPFEPGDTINGLSISGTVQLFSDTSLVRVILSDINGNEWMVYEAYPMIVEGTVFEIEEECDETCYLNEFVPLTIAIQIIDALIQIDSLNVNYESYEEAGSLQFQSKRNKDFQKINQMNLFIQERQLEWTAGDNEVLRLFYQDKSRIYGFSKYNALGFDYYVSGTFNFIHAGEVTDDYIKNSGSLRDEFDWRSKHDANIEGSPYFSSDGYGWLTDFRRQGQCGSCWAFASTAAVEAVTNLYFNQHCDFDLAEKDIICCAIEDGCGGGSIKDALNFINNPGTFNEENFEYDPDNPDIYSGCCGQDLGEPEYVLKCGPYKILHNTAYESIDTIKTRLITSGPLATEIFNPYLNHAMTLAAYYTDNNEYIHFVFKDSRHSYYTDMFLMWDEIQTMCTVRYPIVITEGTSPELKILDADEDGYYNWGIRPIPSNWQSPCLITEEDWNDNNNRIGPCDDNFIGQPVMPEMEVTCGLFNGIPVKNNDLLFISGNNLVENYYTFLVNNPGNAQLNFQKILIPIPAHGRVEIDYQNHSGLFEVSDRDYLDTAICMESQETFEIVMHQGAQPGDLAHIIIYTDETDISNFEFTMVFDACATQGGTEVITSPSTVWSDPYKSKCQDILISNGASLTITGTLILSSEVDIYVAPGGALILDGGRLTSSCVSLWNGIDVWGDQRYAQLRSYQGYVEIKNKGVVEYARCGIENALYYNNSYTYTGGIFNIAEADFINNQIGIRFWPYHNYNPGNGQPMPNFSGIKNSDFITNADLYSRGFNPLYQICMYEIDDVNILGSNFINDVNINDLQQGDEAGIGIISYETSFKVDHLCTQPNQIPCEEFTPCHFENLEYGIWSGYITSAESARIRNSEFINNITGIDLCASAYAEVLQNIFEVRKSENEPFDEMVYCGLYLDNCTGYQVEENNFYTFLDDFQREESVSVGMVIYNSGPNNNEIYNNIFDGLYAGLIAQEVNRNESGDKGLQIKCNNLLNNVFDIAVTKDPESTGITGIAKDQGFDQEFEPGALAGNRFTLIEPEQNPEPEGNYYNIGQPITYWHHSNSNGYNIVPTRHSDDPAVVPTPDQHGHTFIPEESCSSHLSGGGPGITLEKSNLITNSQKADSIETLLNLLVDNSNTEELLSDIQNSCPEEGVELYSELMQISPFISDTALIESVTKEAVLLPGMVTDILMANPQSAKSDKVMGAVDERINPLTDDQLADIGEGRFIQGAKEEMESGLSHFQSLTDRSKDNLIRIFYQDTLSLSPVDSILEILILQQSVSDSYQKAFAYFTKGDSVNVINSLNDIPSSYNLTSAEIDEHALYEDYFDILFTSDTNILLIRDLDSNQKLTLYNILDNSHGVLKRMAGNLLIINDSIEYFRRIDLPQPGLKSGHVRTWPVKKIHKGDVIKIYPNPANEVVIIEVRLKDSTSDAKLLIVDTKGVIIYQVAIEHQSEHFIIPASLYKPGFYLCRITNRNLAIESKGFVITRH